MQSKKTEILSGFLLATKLFSSLRRLLSKELHDDNDCKLRVRSTVLAFSLINYFAINRILVFAANTNIMFWRWVQTGERNVMSQYRIKSNGNSYCCTSNWERAPLYLDYSLFMGNYKVEIQFPCWTANILFRSIIFAILIHFTMGVFV